MLSVFRTPRFVGIPRVVRTYARKRIPVAAENTHPMDTYQAPLLTLPYAKVVSTAGYGTLVTEKTPTTLEVIPLAEVDDSGRARKTFRHPDGTLIHGTNAQEARLHPNTLRAMQNKKQTEIPFAIARAINNHMLRLHHPETLRIQAARTFVDLHNNVHQAAKTTVEVDAHIAAVFPQNFTSIYQALYELRNRTADFNPQRVLDIGFGPATGMVALNELMGEEFRPEVKEAVITSNPEMQKRAKIILSRQVCEGAVVAEVKVPEAELEAENALPLEETMEMESSFSAIVDHEEMKEVIRARNEQDEAYRQRTGREAAEPTVYDHSSTGWGPVDTSKIKIKTKLRDDLPLAKKYDLIIMTHQLLTDTAKFPRQVDRSVEQVLDLLEPQGHLVLVERGNPLGFEIIARARQVMIRPERHPLVNAKIPQPWIRGASVKPKNLPLVYGAVKLDAEAEALKLALDQKYGAVSAAEMRFEFETAQETSQSSAGGALADTPSGSVEKTINGSANPVEETAPEVDYHLSIIAPCSHHGKCPLQTGKPDYYTFPAGAKLPWCHFSKNFTRPPFSMELKKGLRLATPWASPTDGIGIKGSASVGKGRAGGNNHETANYSYLIVERAANSAKALSKIRAMTSEGYDRVRSREAGRTFSPKAADLSNQRGTGFIVEADDSTWPRIVSAPRKASGHVTFTACAASGQMESWVVAKSKNKQAYHDARKVRLGDAWAFASQTVNPIQRDFGKDLKVCERHEFNQQRITKKEQEKARKLSENELQRKLDLHRNSDAGLITTAAGEVMDGSLHNFDAKLDTLMDAIAGDLDKDMKAPPKRDKLNKIVRQKKAF